MGFVLYSSQFRVCFSWIPRVSSDPALNLAEWGGVSRGFGGSVFKFLWDRLRRVGFVLDSSQFRVCFVGIR